jgi:hypothetical protein
MAKEIIKKDYAITALIDDLVYYNFKFNQGRYDGTIPHMTLLKLIEKSEI